MIEKNFDIPFISELALREKQIQQNYRPIIAVHKWFARRPGTLFRGLLLSEFNGGKLRESFFQSHDFSGIKVADPFMGGGTPLIEANRIGCDIVGFDINPMAYWIVRQEIEYVNLEVYTEAAKQLQRWLAEQVGRFYRTTCATCQSHDASVKYFIWVKTRLCDECSNTFDLFPGYLLSQDKRHPKNVIICSICGELCEVSDCKNLGHCPECSTALRLDGPARRNRCNCPQCGRSNQYPTPLAGAPQHRMVAIEYYCSQCKGQHKGRFFKKPDALDLAQYDEAKSVWKHIRPSHVPSDNIPNGDETDRLLKWGYKKYRDLFNERQLLGLELSCQFIDKHPKMQIRNALATNLSDLLRYQNMLCRYDTMALKSLDIFSVHGYPVGLVQCESNFLGVKEGSNGPPIGSGGWLNIVEKYTRAKTYCDRPFEVQYQNGKKVQVPIRGEWIGEHKNGSPSTKGRIVELFCESSTLTELPPDSLDAVFTDPPYFANVQYAELMDFCYVWLRRLVTDTSGAFEKRSTRNENELTGNITLDRGLDHFAEGLAAVFQRMIYALKSGAPLAFTYHHNSLAAYLPIAVAILDSGLTCSASLPCPAEMAGSIHINGTGSSVIDTVFVCRSTGSVPRRTIVSSAVEIAALVRDDVQQLSSANFKPTQGDIRCIAYGHLIRLAIWKLRASWQASVPTSAKLDTVSTLIEELGGWHGIERCMSAEIRRTPRKRMVAVQEEATLYMEDADEIRF